MKQFCKRTLCLLLTLALTAGLLSAFSLGASAAELSERQKAVLAVAIAYYDKGQSVQYDGATLVDDVPRSPSGKTRSTNCAPPEYGTPNETLFSVCSDYAHQVYYEAFGYHLCGSAGACWTDALLQIPKDDPMTIWYYEKSSGKDPKDAIHEMFQVAQPGDVFTTFSTAGHTMIYVGDILGDGGDYMLHCFGARFNTDTGKDNREYPVGDKGDPRYGVISYADANGGAIRLTPNAEAHLKKAYGKGDQERMNLVRPLNGMDESKYPISAATKYRMSHPRLSIDRLVVDKSRFRSTYKGETLTLSLTLKNSSGAAYDLPITEKVPAGTTVKKPFEGATVSGDTMKWTVKLDAGETKTLTCEYEVTADRGAQIVFGGSSVGDIPSNTIPIQVGGKKLNAEQLDKLSKLGTGVYDSVLAGVKDAGFPNAVYQKVLGLNVNFPDVKTVVKTLTEERKFGTTETSTARVFKDRSAVAAADLPNFELLIPTLHGGRNSWNAWGHERMNDPKDMHLEPGDVIFRANDIRIFKITDTLIYLGDGKYAKYGSSNKPVKIVEEPEFVKSLLSAVFYGMRPTLAYDDIQSVYSPVAPPPAKEFKFTDVKESDWFYTYVKDLVEDGTVNGMTATTFVPNGTLTYGQALKLITLAVGEKEPIKTGTHWASGYLSLAKEKGWIKSSPNLDGTITRLALCQIAAKAKGLTEQPASNPFTDTDSKDVLALNKVGVINGMTATTFQPQGLLTRAQISKIIWTLRKV